MKTQLLQNEAAKATTELLVVFAADQQTSKEPNAKADPVLLTEDAALLSAAKSALASGEFKAAASETILLHAPAGLKASRLLIVGLGKKAKASVHDVRKAAGTAVRFAKPRSIRELTIVLPSGESFAATRHRPRSR